MFKKLRGIYSHDISIDLGTSNTLIYTKGKGIVLDEPSVVAIQNNAASVSASSIRAVGLEAKEMLGRTPGHIRTIRPLKDGVIADFSVTRKMLLYFIQKVHSNTMFKPSPRVLICVPCGSTQVERRAIRESVIEAGARSVYMLEEPVAAAIGAGLPVDEPVGNMVLDIGGGTTEVAVISMNGIIYSRTVRGGGDRLDEAIINFVRRNYGYIIGDLTAEYIKHQLSGADTSHETQTIEVHGRNITAGVPGRFTMDSNDLAEAIREPLSDVIESVKHALENIPPEIASDVAENGIVLTGGGALLKDLHRHLSNETGVQVTVAEDPLTCVVRGGGKYLEMIDDYGEDLLGVN